MHKNRIIAVVVFKPQWWRRGASILEKCLELRFAFALPKNRWGKFDGTIRGNQITDWGANCQSDNNIFVLFGDNIGVPYSEHVDGYLYVISKSKLSFWHTFFNSSVHFSRSFIIAINDDDVLVCSRLPVCLSVRRQRHFVDYANQGKYICRQFHFD